MALPYWVTPWWGQTCGGGWWSRFLLPLPGVREAGRGWAGEGWEEEPRALGFPFPTAWRRAVVVVVVGETSKVEGRGAERKWFLGSA